MARSRSSVSAGLEQVRHQIDRWRSTRRKVSPMPAELWAAAVALSRIHGVSMTSRVLGLSYTSLKDRVASTKPKVGSREPTRFVELTPGSLMDGSVPSGAELELCHPDGAKLVLRLREPSGLDLAGLAEAFWRRRS